MYNNHSRLLLGIAVFSVSVLGVLATFIVYEYHALAGELDELIQVKQEYNNYLLLFKRAMLENDRIKDLEKDDACDGVEKKKVDDSSEDAIVWVNRNHDHLAKRARAYSKNRNVDQLTADRQPEATASGKRSTTRTRTSKRTRTRKKIKKRRSWISEDSQAMLASPDEIAFIWPLAKKSFWVSYGFGPRRHPSGRWEFHRGVDLAAPLGTPVYAAADGVVTHAHYAGGYGKSVVVEHTNKFKTRYAHLSRILVNVGDDVRQGDILGKVGATGNVRGKNGVHLHFEVMVYDKRVNPFYFLN